MEAQSSSETSVQTHPILCNNPEERHLISLKINYYYISVSYSGWCKQLATFRRTV
jgi:hypothetical protein